MTDSYHAAHIPGTVQEYRWPTKIGVRGAERLYRRRELVHLDAKHSGAIPVPVGPFIAIMRARQIAYVAWARHPTLVSMTEAQYQEICEDPHAAKLAEVSGTGTIEEIYGMWIERRDNDDLEGVCWVEIVDIRKAS